jgi:hypothetical protein
MQAHHDESAPAHSLPDDWARLIRKLRWIGLDEEANRLQQAVRTVPPAERDGDTVSAGPFSTD